MLSKEPELILIHYQMEALKHGLVSLVDKLQDAFFELTSIQGSDPNLEAVHEYLAECVSNALSGNQQN